MVLTCPAKEPRWRIDGISIDSGLYHAVASMYTVGVGQSVLLGLFMHISPEEETEGASRRTISPEIIQTPEFQEQMQAVLDRYHYLQGKAW